LIAISGGRLLKIPTARAAARYERHRRIVEALDHHSHEEVARRFRINLRTVYRHAKHA